MDLPTYGLLLLLMQLEETIALNFRIFTDAQLEMIPNILIDLHEKMFVLTFKSTRPRGSTEPAMRIEAAAYRGKPVYFELIGPWTRPERMRPYEPSVGEKAGLVFSIVLLLSLLVAGAMLARRNLRLGRGDRRGAFRLAGVVFAAWAVAWLFGAHHIPNFAELPIFT